jgi:hypothetical protein
MAAGWVGGTVWTAGIGAMIGTAVVPRRVLEADALRVGSIRLTQAQWDKLSRRRRRLARTSRRTLTHIPHRGGGVLQLVVVCSFAWHGP